MLESGGLYRCSTCGDDGTPGKMHAAGGEARIKVAISSSMLHEFWLQEGYAGDSAHIDWITSPGGTLQSLQNMWQQEYGTETRPQDILVIAGLNNIKQKSVAVIMGRIETFTAAVFEQTRLYHPANPSTINFATLPYPPQFCSFLTNGLLPYDGFVNKLELMMELNDNHGAQRQCAEQSAGLVQDTV